MSQAGPSRTRRPSSPPQEVDSSDSEPQAVENGHANGSRRKRPRTSLRDELFEKQDAEEKLRIGNSYRALQTTADDMKTNLENIDAGDLVNMLKRQNKLFGNVRDTGLASVDARLMMTTTETAANLVRKMKFGGSTFDVDEFLVRVKTTLGLDRPEMEDIEDDEDELEAEDDAEREVRRERRARAGALGDWEKIGWMAAGLYRRVPGVEFMYGPLSVQHKKRAVSQRQRRLVVGEEVRPEEIQTQRGDGRAPKDITVSNVVSISRTLDRLDPDGTGVNFFRLVVNPNDFGQTVENCFYTSFLVREGRVGISVKDDGEILIRATKPHDPDIDGDIPKNQAVLELDIATWKEAIRVFNITESAIPDRPKVDHSVPAGNAWYSGGAADGARGGTRAGRSRD